ncbi:hypothetical protein WJX77_002162 [Trebouxia sp. C0004]
MNDDWKKQKETARKQAHMQFNKYEKLATLGDDLTLAEDRCIKPPGAPDQVTQEILVRYTEVGWQLWNMCVKQLFRSCVDANFHPMMKIPNREWEAEVQRIAALHNDEVRERQLAILEEGRQLTEATLSKYQAQPHSFRRALMEATNTPRAIGEKHDVFLPTWAEKLKGRRLGCFIIDAPMGLHDEGAWTLTQVISLVKSIELWCTPPYTIVLYSLYNLGKVQRALDEADQKKKGKQGEGLQVTHFIMVKDTMQEGRAGPGCNLSTHMTQEVLVIHPGSVDLNFEAEPHPVRFFPPLSGNFHNDQTTSGGGFF